MDLYAPLASRLGIDWLKRELEDLAFKYLYPVEYADITGRLESTLGQRQAYVEEVLGILQEKLRANNIPPLRIMGRPKHIYSIYSKLVVQNIPLERVYDKVAFRIIVHTVKECYEALGIIHANWHRCPAGSRTSSVRPRPTTTSPCTPRYRAARQFHRDPDPHRGDGPGGPGGYCRALGLQGGAEDHQPGCPPVQGPEEAGPVPAGGGGPPGVPGIGAGRAVRT